MPLIATLQLKTTTRYLIKHFSAFSILTIKEKKEKSIYCERDRKKTCKLSLKLMKYTYQRRNCQKMTWQLELSEENMGSKATTPPV